MELIRKQSVKRYSRELNEMIETLNQLTTEKIATILIYGVWLRATLGIEGDSIEGNLPVLVGENGEFDPELQMYPLLLSAIEDRMSFFNREGEPAKSFSLSLWVHTLRSLMRPELSTLARKMWSILMSSKPVWETSLKQIREENIQSGIPYDDVLHTERYARAILKSLPPKQLHRPSGATAQNEEITLLLPYYLDKSFKEIFEDLGFTVIWAQNQNELEELLKYRDPDLAIEWQHGERDFTIRNLLRKHGKETVTFLALNWNGKIPSNFESLGYIGVVQVPFKIFEIKLKFHEVLSPSKRNLLKQLPIWGE
ncbi:MAG: hypothetical protein JRF50_16300 [Deltaproteobacteria bacterium]|nr:hypothetical protein [Deltaproteobacteria bacterium]